MFDFAKLFFISSFLILLIGVMRNLASILCGSIKNDPQVINVLPAVNDRESKWKKVTKEPSRNQKRENAISKNNVKTRILKRRKKIYPAVVFVGTFSRHGFILTPKRRLFCFGSNERFQLGVGDKINRLSPQLHPKCDGRSVLKVACGHYSSVWLIGKKDKRSVYVSGAPFGKMKLNKYGARSYHITWFKKPKLIISDKNIVDVECGFLTTFLRFSNGLVFGMGFGLDGQLGIGKDQFIQQHTGKIKTHSHPDFDWVQVKEKVKAIAAGELHTAFLAVSGNVWVTGSNEGFKSMYYQSGASGIGRMGTLRVLSKTFFPVKIKSLKNVKKVGCGRNYTIFLTDSRIHYCGKNDMESNPTLVPTLVQSPKMDDFHAGCGHAILESEDGDLYSFGHGSFSRNVIGNKLVPEKIRNFTDDNTIVQIQASLKNSYFVDCLYNIYACGTGGKGQLFNGKKQTYSHVKNCLIDPGDRNEEIMNLLPMWKQLNEFFESNPKKVVEEFEKISSLCRDHKLLMEKIRNNSKRYGFYLDFRRIELVLSTYFEIQKMNKEVVLCDDFPADGSFVCVGGIIVTFERIDMSSRRIIGKEFEIDERNGDWVVRNYRNRLKKDKCKM